MAHASFFFALNAKVRYFAPRIAGFWLWFVAVFGLVAIGLGIRVFESGKLFRDQFESGYNALNGEFCPLTCGIACEIECDSTGIDTAIEQLNAVDEMLASVIEAIDLQICLPTVSESIIVEFSELGEWWLNSKKQPYKSERHLKAAYEKAVKNHREELTVV